VNVVQRTDPASLNSRSEFIPTSQPRRRICAPRTGAPPPL